MVPRPHLRRTASVAALVVVAVAAVVLGPALALQARTSPVVLSRVTEVRHPSGPAELVSWVTGPHAPVPTDGRWNVHGTDLGFPLLHDGALYLVFGDTWGADGPEGSDWRSNTLARLASPDPADGFAIASMVTDADGQAAELLASAKHDGVEKTVIPTAGISVGDRMVVHYMSVRRWVVPGRWEVGHAGFAWSADDGRTWTVPRDAELDGDGPFAQVAMVADGDRILVYGTPAGRAGDVRLARVDAESLMEPERFEYWTGAGWSPDQERAAVVIDGPAGELSVRWNEWLRSWVMLTLDESVPGIVLRTAPAPTGPWSPAVVVTTPSAFPALYAPYQVPVSRPGPDLWFTMSVFGPYQVGLLRVSLPELGLGPGGRATPEV